MAFHKYTHITWKKKENYFPTDDGCSTCHESFDLWAFTPPSTWQLYFCDKNILTVTGKQLLYYNAAK